MRTFKPTYIKMYIACLHQKRQQKQCYPAYCEHHTDSTGFCTKILHGKLAQLLSEFASWWENNAKSRGLDADIWKHHRTKPQYIDGCESK